MSTAVAVVLFLAVTTYAVFGGADFGAGFWDLVAGGAARGARPREVIDHSIGPVWEANHVWLIFIFVVLWTGFPEAYASITLTLFVPLALAAFGIVAARLELRVPQDRVPHPRPPQLRRRLRPLVGRSSPTAWAPIAGAIASGRVPAGGVAGDPWDSWVNPTSVLGGVLAVIVVAYLAAVYLVWDARRLGRSDMAEYFRRRAIGAAVVAGVAAFVGIFVLRDDARYVFDGLTARALPLVIVSAVCGTASLVLLLRDAARGARLLAIVAVASIVVGWGVAQWPYILPTSLEVSDAAAPSGTLATLVVATVLLVAHRRPRLQPALHPRPEEPPPRRGNRLSHAPETIGWVHSPCVVPLSLIVPLPCSRCSDRQAERRGEGVAGFDQRRRAVDEAVGGCRHRLEGGERPAGRDPNLGMRVATSGAHRDRRIVVCHQRQPAIASESVEVVERPAADRRRLSPTRHARSPLASRGHRGRDVCATAGAGASGCAGFQATAGTDAIRMPRARLAGPSARPSCRRSAGGRGRRRRARSGGGTGTPARRHRSPRRGWRCRGGPRIVRSATRTGRRAGRGSAGRLRHSRAAGRRGRRRRPAAR